jgi:hypothetical protein
MKFNKWTLGLAAVGVVSLTSAARADEKMNSLQTALSDTTISGSVSASMNWAIAPSEGKYQDSPASYIPFQGPTKQDGFNLDVVRLTIAKPEDESPWASGYQVDLMFGPDAVGYNPSANGAPQYYGGYGPTPDFSIKQAYVTLRTPVGSGIDWKIGVFDTVIGYEVTDAGSNPNYTRSWGYAIEPTEHTGILGSYKINDEWSVSAGVANTLSAGINTRAFNYPYDYGNNYSEDWHKTLMGSVTFTAPSSWGWAAGSSFYGGIVYGFNGADGGNSGFHQGGNQANYYAGATLNTPLKQLTAGFAFDYAENFGGGGDDKYTGETNEYDTFEYNVLAAGVYATYKVTDKLSLNGRAEYVYGEDVVKHSPDYPGGGTFSADGYELTGTVEYDLWANVMSRLELRWDHANTHYSELGDYLYVKDSVGLYANVIYKF